MRLLCEGDGGVVVGFFLVILLLFGLEIFKMEVHVFSQ